MQQLKSFTGKEANKIIEKRSAASLISQQALRDTGKRSAASLNSQQALRYPEQRSAASLNSQQALRSSENKRFWQAESFDRIIRNRNDMVNKIAYTLNNPVKSGLISHWSEWKYTYCRPEFLEE